ncbi:PspC domain-containing protein [Nocardioides pantholopis]|uniref:PspC domain-containing protein n=1 Tax=Nocardioides pantholopis TaxID=2483798 RepID=UPI0013DE52DB|nr:PspC domain-containing protein [Nocardioides pantholopis]
MTSSPPDAPTEPDGGPRVSRDDVRDLGRLRRSTTDRRVAGVAGGLGRHLDVDPVVLRVALVVLIFFGGAGLIVYAGCWLLVPEDDGRPPIVPLDERSRTVALVIVGTVAGLSLLGDTLGGWGYPWPLALLAVVAAVALTRRKPPAPVYGPPAPGYGPPAPGYGPPAPGYGPPAPGAPGYGPAQPGPVAPAPRNPRRCGPLLFWAALALSLLGLGVLGLLDGTGTEVAEGAYPAVVVAVCGVLLVVGAFYGRAGGLILVGLLAAFAMAADTAVDQVEQRSVLETPQTAAEVESGYEIRSGELVLDLSQVADPAELAGRRVRVEAGIGQLEVIVPAGLAVRAEGEVGIGNVRLFGEDNGGFGVSSGAGLDGTDSSITGALVIEADLGIGEVRVRQAAPAAPESPESPEAQSKEIAR